MIMCDTVWLYKSMLAIYNNLYDNVWYSVNVLKHASHIQQSFESLLFVFRAIAEPLLSDIWQQHTSTFPLVDG